MTMMTNMKKLRVHILNHRKDQHPQLITICKTKSSCKEPVTMKENKSSSNIIHKKEHLR